MADASIITQPTPNSQVGIPKIPGTDMIQVGNTTMTPQMFQERTNEIRNDYALSLDNINAKFTELGSKIYDIQSGISQQLQQNQNVARSSYNAMIGDMNRSIANIQGAQNQQVGNAASQLDAMLSSGQFGGNVYRAQQVYSSNMSTIISTAMQTVADVTMQYRNAAESMRMQYSQQQLAGYIQGASVVISSMTDLAKTYAAVTSDMTAKKNQQINDVFSLKVNVDIANAQMQSQADIAAAELSTQKSIASMQVEAQKLMTQMQLDASMNETILNIELGREQVQSQERIANRSNEVKINLANMEIEFQREMQNMDRELQSNLQKLQLDQQKYLETRNQDMQYELGLIQLDSAREARREQIEHETRLEEARLNQQYSLAANQAAQQMSQFNRQYALQRQQYEQSAYASAQETVATNEFLSRIDQGSGAAHSVYTGVMDKAQKVLAEMDKTETAPSTEVQTNKPAARFAVQPHSDSSIEYKNSSGEMVKLTWNDKEGKYTL